MQIRFRLSGFDAPESYRPKTEEKRDRGYAAANYLEDLIGDKDVVIKSSKQGKYRWLCEIYLNEDLDFIWENSVNCKMVEEGHVK